MITTERTLLHNTDLAGLMSFPAIQSRVETTRRAALPKPSLRVEALDFKLSLDLPIIDFDFSLSQWACVCKVGLFEDTTFDLHLALAPNNGGDSFHVAQAGIKIADKEAATSAQADFVAHTFNAVMGLSRRLRLIIPSLNQDLELSFEVPLRALSHSLQVRQLAYRVMVIEKALGVTLNIPTMISGDEAGTIAYAYYAITKQEFNWTLQPFVRPLPATRELLSSLPVNNQATPITLAPEPVVKELFGHKLDLGLHGGVIEDAVIDNYEEVKSGLKALDGREVLAQTRSMSGQIRVKAIDMPRLPDAPWPPPVQQMIDIEEILDNFMVERYFALAEATLTGLDDAARAACTTRPELAVQEEG